MFIRILPTTLIQIFCENLLYFQVIFKSMKIADDTFLGNSECEWVKSIHQKKYQLSSFFLTWVGAFSWILIFHHFFCHIAAKSRLGCKKWRKTKYPAKNHRLTLSHWQLSHMTRPGFFFEKKCLFYYLKKCLSSLDQRVYINDEFEEILFPPNIEVATYMV